MTLPGSVGVMDDIGLETHMLTYIAILNIKIVHFQPWNRQRISTGSNSPPTDPAKLPVQWRLAVRQRICPSLLRPLRVVNLDEVLIRYDNVGATGPWLTPASCAMTIDCRILFTWWLIFNGHFDGLAVAVTLKRHFGLSSGAIRRTKCSVWLLQKMDKVNFGKLMYDNDFKGFIWLC